MNIKRRVCQVVQSLHISTFMEKKSQLVFQKKVTLIGATSGGLITLRRVLVISFCFCFTLRTIFKSSFVCVCLGGGGGGGVKVGREGMNSSFKFKNFSQIQLLYLLTYFSYLFSVVWLLFSCDFLSFFCCFVSYMGWVGA